MQEYYVDYVRGKPLPELKKRKTFYRNKNLVPTLDGGGRVWPIF